MDLKSLTKESKRYEKFCSKIDILESGCWKWKGFHDKDGYAGFHIHQKTNKCHRYSYTIHKGPIPEGLTIDHLCKNKGCVNPDHLEAVSLAENIKRANSEGIKRWFKKISPEQKAEFMKQKSMIAAAKKLAATHCRRGHEWKPETTYVTKEGHRRCNICFYNAPSMINKAKNNGKKEENSNV